MYSASTLNSQCDGLDNGLKCANSWNEENLSVRNFHNKSYQFPFPPIPM